AGLEFLALKGLTHCALFGTSPAGRVQYDIDLWLSPDSVHAARRVLEARGYESMPGMEDVTADHLPALIRKTGWQWRGDFFDAEIPLAIELHYQFWDDRFERLSAPGVEDFWRRRIRLPVAGVDFHLLCRQDALAYAALHLLKHVLRGSVKPFPACEMARVLDSFSTDEAFGRQWSASHPPGLRRLQAVAFRVAREWFGGRAAPIIGEELDRLPAGAKAWFTEFAVSPIL